MDIACRSHAGVLLGRLSRSYGCGLSAGHLSTIVHALTVDHATLQFNISELAVSFTRDRRPTIRALAEISNVVVPDEATADVLRSIASTALSATPGADCDTALCDDLITLAYDTYERRAPPRPLRFGIALERGADALPGMRVYLDLFAHGREHANQKLLTLLARTVGTSAHQRIAAIATDGNGAVHPRGVAVTLRGERRGDVTVYTSGVAWSRATLHRMFQRWLGTAGTSLLERVLRVISPITNADVLRDAMLICFTFSPTDVYQHPTLKLDCCLAKLAADDSVAMATALELAAVTDVPMTACEQALCDVTGYVAPSRTQRVCQYVSLDVSASNPPRVSVHFRPPDLATQHMAPAVRSRRKPELLASIDEACTAAIAALELARTTGFSEATHRMLFPRSAGFSDEREHHSGTVFQTALIADALVEAARAGFRVDMAGLRVDAERLGAQLAADGGGWRYFPTLHELPPDADDLAQVLTLFVRLDAPQLALCEAPVRLLLERQSVCDGSFSTWIFDRDGTTVGAQRMLHAVAKFWGDTPDVEVISNALYALNLYDAQGFHDPIIRGVEFVAAQQDDGGFWTSTWYCGPYYATFVCARALAAVVPGHAGLTRAAGFVITRQLADGSWGSPPDTADTSLALRTLGITGVRGKGTSAAIERGVRSLLGRRQSDGFWSAMGGFIQMDPHRAASCRGPGRITYRSRTMATALALHALCSVRAEF
jgi:squalene-hopene/tetraprenyl-beta-curcumene cyclase